MNLEKIKQLIISKHRVFDFACNFSSLALVGLAGIVVNIVIGAFYDASAIGSFNQVFAVFLIAGQAGAMGIHLSTQKSLSEYLHDDDERVACLGGAVVSITLVGFPTAAVYALLAPLAGTLLGSEAIQAGIYLSAPGLLFFILNKLVLSAFNGLDWLRTYALIQAMRPVLLVVTLVAIAQSGEQASTLPLALTVSEGSICILGGGILWSRELRKIEWRASVQWISRHFSFGFRSFFSNLLLELNTRIDIIVLGLFMDDRLVGIYSFSALIVEGIAQLPVVVRTILHVETVQRLMSNDRKEIEQTAKRVRNVTYLGMGILFVFAITIFPWGISIFALSIDEHAAWEVFTILMLGLFLASGYIPFSNILLQAGFPGRHAMLISLLVLINFLGNCALIPNFGLNGAAFATAFSFALLPVLLKIGTMRFLRIKI